MFPLLDILNVGTKIIDRVLPDPAAKLAATQKLAELQQSGELEAMKAELAAMTAQTDINKVEAASSDRWVSGWRPYIGWVCGTGLAMVLIIRPLFVWASSGFHADAFPVPDTPLLMTTLTGMLGLGTLRTVEKIKGAENNRS